MTTTVNTSNSVSAPTTSNRLGDQEISTILEESTTEKTSDIALETLQQQLSLILKNQDQLSTELKQLSLKFSLILQNQDQLSKQLKQPITSPCPPLPPPPPVYKINFKDQENSKKISPFLQTTTILSNGNLHRSQSLRIKTIKEPIVTEQQITDGLKNLRSPKNGNETSLSLQTGTTPLLEIKPTSSTEKISQNQLKYIEKKHNENDKNSEIKENISVADKIKLFS